MASIMPTGPSSNLCLYTEINLTGPSFFFSLGFCIVVESVDDGV
jgi:hypothetical protein